MRLVKARTLHALHDAVAERLYFSPTDAVDAFSSMETELFHVYAEARSMEWDYTLERLWVPETRWRTMLRQYVDPYRLTQWLDLIADRESRGNRRRGVYVFRMNEVAPRKGGKGTVRSMGGCMLTLSVAFNPYPRAVLHSRTCYVGYLSHLDLSVAYHLVRLAAEPKALVPGDFRFTWFLEAAQVHGFRTLAWPLGDPAVYEEFLKCSQRLDYPALRNSRKHYEKYRQQDEEGVLYSEMPFTSYRRVRKRFHTEVMGYDYAKQFEDLSTGKSDHRAYKPLPVIKTTDLSLSAIGF